MAEIGIKDGKRLPFVSRPGSKGPDESGKYPPNGKTLRKRLYPPTGVPTNVGDPIDNAKTGTTSKGKGARKARGRQSESE